jgi:hypothetical protein
MVAVVNTPPFKETIPPYVAASVPSWYNTAVVNPSIPEPIIIVSKIFFIVKFL